MTRLENIATPIPLSVPQMGEAERLNILECIDTNWVSYLGPFVDRFERDLAAVAEAEHAVVTASGTAALHLALIAAEVTRDSEVIMPAMSFVAPANAVRYCDAWPTFVDLDRSSWQLDADQVESFLAEDCAWDGKHLVNRHTGRQVRALLAVHLLGDIGPVDRLAELAQKFNLFFIEDSAECLGARYQGRAIGACAKGMEPARRLAITSFNGNKIVTCGGGGAVLTDDLALANKVKHLSTTAKSDAIRFVHDQLGYNYRMTNLAAAVGVAQLAQLEKFVTSKRSHADRYYKAFSMCDQITRHPECEGNRSIFWLYTILIDRPSWPIIEALNNVNIQARPAWTPLHELPEFRSEAYVHSSDFADYFAQHAISLPSSVSLTVDQQDRVIQSLLANMGPPMS